MSTSNRASVSEVVTLEFGHARAESDRGARSKIDGLFSEQAKLTQNVEKVNDRLDNVYEQIGTLNSKIVHLESVQNEHRHLFTKRDSNRQCANMSKGHHEREDEVGFVAAKKEGCCEGLCGSLRGLCHFMYNSETHLVMGRNCKQWAQLLVFYVIFYACLIGFWVACLYGFLSTTNELLPTLTGFDSMLKLNPAIGYRPQPDFESNLIKFNASNSTTYATYLQDANNFLKPYFDDSVQSKLIDCNNGLTANKTAACQFRPNIEASQCFPAGETAPYKLGFDKGTPCIVLKMNRIIGWLPRNKPNSTEYSDVKLRCRGENDADRENLGQIEYYPNGVDEKGMYGRIDAKYFPYMNQPNYLSPLVFVRFPNLVKYTVALIWCQFEQEEMDFMPGTYWASMQLNERSGGTHFELLVDDKSSYSVVVPVQNLPVVTATTAPK